MDIESTNGSTDTLFMRPGATAASNGDAGRAFAKALEDYTIPAGHPSLVTGTLLTDRLGNIGTLLAGLQDGPDRTLTSSAQLGDASAVADKIGDALYDLRRAFSDAGMSIIDAVKFTKSANGDFGISGWGKGVEVSHPQGKFIEAVLNGKAPGFEDLTEQAKVLFEKIETLYAELQDIEEKNAELTGRDFVRRESFFDGGGVIMSTETTNAVSGVARKLAGANPAAYAAFRDRLGAELELLTENQILSRFHFNETRLADLDARLRDYFDEA